MKKKKVEKAWPVGNFIVKVQIPVASNKKFEVDEPCVLIYNEDRSYETMIPFSNYIVGRMNGSYKKYFNAYLNEDKQLILGLAAREEGW